MVFLFSMPLVAGFLMRTFPVLSTEVGKPRFSPKFLINAMTLSSFFEGLGTALSLEKFFQRILGSIFVRLIMYNILISTKLIKTI